MFKTSLNLISIVLLVLGLGQLVSAEIIEPTGEVVSEAWYKTIGKDDAVGYFKVKLIRPTEGIYELAILGEMCYRQRGTVMTMNMLTWCKDNEYYSPCKLEFESSYDKGGDIQYESWIAHVEPENPNDSSSLVLKSTWRKKKIRMKLPDQVVTEFGLLQIIGLLPFEQDFEFKFNSLESVEFNLKLDHVVKYVGREEVEIDGEDVQLHKFTHTGSGIHRINYWVDDKHELVRIGMDGDKVMVLTTEDEAKKLVID